MSVAGAVITLGNWLSSTGFRGPAILVLAGSPMPGPGLSLMAANTAALAVHIMTNTALTGATYDIDGGEQFVSA
jgi:hypothetical protein